jgi:hypothetical protein
LASGALALAVLASGAVAGTPALAEPDPDVVAGVVAPDTVSISGTVAVGETVTAQEGVWTPDGTTFTYEWRSGDVPIDGVTGRSLVLTPDLEGATLTVVVTGTAPDATTSSLTSAPAVVAPGQATGPQPTISGGAAKVGVPLTAVPGTWSPAGATFTYQWKSAGEAISGATAATYIPRAADLGQALTVVVSGAAPGYTAADRESVPTAPVAPGSWSAAPAPTLSGAVRVESTVTAQPGAWAPTAAIAYQWRRDGALIAGATGRTYRPVAAERGRRLSVRVTASRPGYPTTIRYSAETVIGVGVFTSAPAPTITGSAYVGSVLTARPGTWSPSASLSYRWFRNGTAISGATASTYRPTLTDHAKRITVRVTATRTAFASVYRTSAATAPVAKPFTTVVAPTISGTARVGATLTARVGTWSPTASFTWQWKRNGVAIPGATGSTYRLAGADYQNGITVTVTGRRTAYITTSRTSLATARIAAPAPTLTRDGTYRVGVNIGAGTYVSSVSDFCYWERRSNAGDDFAGIIANDLGNGQRIVTVASTDSYLLSQGCGSWTRLVALGAPRTSMGDGVFAEGIHVSPGLYQAPGSDGCYWARLSDFSGDLDGIIDNFFGSGQQYVRIYPGDAGFESSDCGTWRRIAN